MFNFYDFKGDGVIDFEEFSIGVAYTNNKTKTPEKLKRIFEGYDLDGDNYVERKDFLRMFKAFYSLSKVLVRDTVGSLGDDLYEQGHMDQALNGRQPISAIFTSSIPEAARSWNKPTSTTKDDDDEDLTSPVVLNNSRDLVTDEDRELLKRLDDTNGVEDPIEKARRLDFWTFEAEDNYELMLPDEEKDVGSELLFHMALRGINQLLDMLFKEKEKAAVEARLEGSKKESINLDLSSFAVICPKLPSMRIPRKKNKK